MASRYRLLAAGFSHPSRVTAYSSLTDNCRLAPLACAPAQFFFAVTYDGGTLPQE